MSSSSQQSSGIQYMSHAIGSSRESNPSRRICHLRAVPLGHVADIEIDGSADLSLRRGAPAVESTVA